MKPRKFFDKVAYIRELENKIPRRWNEHEEWQECNRVNHPKENTKCLIRIELEEKATGIVEVDYQVAFWNGDSWTMMYFKHCFSEEYEFTITHWKYINKPKGVKE